MCPSPTPDTPLEPTDDGTAEDFEQRGYDAYIRGDHTAAVCAYRRAAELGRQGWANMYFLGHCLRQLGHRPEALAAYRAAYEVAPHVPDSAGRLVEETLEVEGLEAAERLVADLNGEGLGEVRDQWRPLRDGYIASRTGELARAGRNDEAKQLCRSAGHLSELGAAVDELGQHDLAVSYLMEALAEGARDWATFTRLGRALTAVEAEKNGAPGAQT